MRNWPSTAPAIQKENDQERHDSDPHWVDVPHDGLVQVVMTSAEADRFQRWLRDHERCLEAEDELELAEVPVYVLAYRKDGR